jgi:hypothetical protein
MFSWKARFVAVLMLTAATPAMAQHLDRRADLITPQRGHAGPGDLVVDISVTEALPNVFGFADIFGRRRPAGRTVVQYMGIQDGTAYFSRQSVAIRSDETTMSRTPMVVPNISQSSVSGTFGNRPFNGTSTTTDLTVVGPEPHSEQHVGLAPITLGVKVSGRVSVEGHELQVLRIHSDGSIDYAVR